jgi:hypothetical protein
MASISTRGSGSRFITFTDANDERRHITLGKVPMRHAEAVRVNVEDLVSGRIHGHAPRDETTRWLADLDDRLYGKLARVGLVRPRTCATLRGWLDHQ